MRITVISSTGQIMPDRFAKIFKEHSVNTFTVNNLKETRKALKKVKKFKPHKIITVTSQKVHLVYPFLLLKKGEKIHFPYDITHFYELKKKPIPKIKQLIERQLEKKALLKADKIIHKGLAEELTFLPFYNKIKNKPEHLFREFIDKEDIIKKKDMLPKLSKKDGELHLVYVGGLYLKDLPDSESFWKFYPKITKQKIHLHIYSKIPQEAISKIREIEKTDKFLHYEGFLPHYQLKKELTQYDWGVHIFGKPDTKKEKRILEVAFANKNFDYFKSRIPIICSNNLLAVSQFVQNEDIGISSPYKELEDIKIKLKKEYKFLKNKFNKKNFEGEKLISFIGVEAK